MQHRRTYLFILAAMSVGILLTVHAQTLPFKYYTTRDGLPSNRIQCLLQDSRQYLWICTGEGLSVYDGATFKNFTVDEGLPHPFLNCIIESKLSPGTLWIGGNWSGLCRLQNGVFTNFPIEQSQAVHWVGALHEGDDGSIWCGTDVGLFVFRAGRFTKLQGERRAYDGIALTAGSAGEVCFGSGSYIDFYSSSFVHLDSIDLHIREPQQIIGIVREHNDNIWVASNDSSLFLLKGRKRVARYHLHDTPEAIYHDVTRNMLIIAGFSLTMVPLEDFDIRKSTAYSARNGLPNDLLTAILVDRENDLWVGSLTKGLTKLSDRNTLRFNLSSYGWLSGGTTDKRNHVWIPAGAGLTELWRDANGEWKMHFHKTEGDGLGGRVYEAAIDRRRRLWIGTLDGVIACFTMGEGAGYTRLSLRRILRPGPTLPRNYPLMFFLDRKDRLWYSLQPLGVMVLDTRSDEKVLMVLRASKELPLTSVRTMCEDAEGNIWMGGFADGLAVIAAGNIEKPVVRKFTTADGLPDNLIRSIMQGSDGSLWIGTRYGGIALYRNGHFRTISTKNGLVGNVVWDIQQDSLGTIWIASSSGLQSVKVDSPFTFWTTTELLGEGYTSVNIVNNRIVCGISADNLVIYDYSMRRPNTIPPPVYLTRFLVSGKAVGFDQDLELSYSQNNCQVDFVGVSFKDERAVKYQYKLEGIDREWREPTAQRSVTFAALRPGSYRFLVRAMNNDGVSSLAPQSLAFTIAPPLWDRWWFAVLIILLAGSLVATFYRIRISRLLEIERIRTRIAADLHDDVGASLTRITVFGNAAKQEIQHLVPDDPDKPSKIGSLLDEIRATSREAADSMGDLVWAIEPTNDSFDNLMLRLKTYASRVLEAGDIDYDIHIDQNLNIPGLPLEFRRNLLLVVKESLTNIVRYSQAPAAKISIRREDGWLMVCVSDNGVGFDVRTKSTGNGLNNMRRRAAAMKGTVDIASVPGTGTAVTLKARLP